MNVITTAVVFKLAIATALVAVCDVSLAAQPAAVESVQPNPVSVVTIQPVATEKLVAIRDAGRDAQQQIVREAMQQNMLQLDTMPLPALAPVSDALVADSVDVARQLAVK